jgi:hypothetical protein
MLMKTKIPSFILLCFLICNGQVFSQNKVEADLGVGLFEGISLKVKYGNNVQVALCQGIAQKSFWMTGVEGYYHFAGISKHIEQRTFYMMMGFSSTLFAGGYDSFEKIVWYSRLGRHSIFPQNQV